MEEEIWKDVIGQEGKYKVSSYGNVKSLERYVNHPSSANGRYVKERILKKISQNTGYDCVSFKKRTKVLVHSLVAESFLGLRPSGFQVDHINKIRNDNRFKNLRYLSIQDNSAHRGEDSKLAKTNNSEVLEMRQMFDSGVRICDICRHFGYSFNMVRYIVKRIGWKHI